MKPCPEIAVVVPTYSRAERLSELLVALEAQTLEKERFEVVVVDDCSTDGSWERLQSMAERSPLRIRTLRTPRNSGGPAAPRNLGWMATTAPVIAFCDDDSIPKSRWLGAGLEAMESDPKQGVMQGCTLVPDGTDVRKAAPWTIWRTVTKPTPQFEAANIFYRRDALEEVGGFDESMPTWAEDTDLGWKVVEAGWKRGFAPKAVTVHELEERGWRHFAHFAWLDRNLIKVAAAHPQLRREAFWRPWAVDRCNVEFALATLGLLGSLRWRPLLLLAAPYVLMLRVRAIHRGWPGYAGQVLGTIALDSIRGVAHLSASVSNRVFIL